MPNMPIMPIMPNMPIMPHPPKTPMGATPLAPGQRECNPLLPRCGTHRPHLCSSFKLKPDERLYSSLQLSLPQPLAADSNSTLSWASACEVLAVIEPSRMCAPCRAVLQCPRGAYMSFSLSFFILLCVTSLPPSGRSQCTHPLSGASSHRSRARPAGCR